MINGSDSLMYRSPGGPCVLTREEGLLAGFHSLTLGDFYQVETEAHSLGLAVQLGIKMEF